MTPKAQRKYLDPLDAIWLTVAARIGFRVERSSDVFASTDGDGVMHIGTPETLDADDCLAQMILHELCHSLVEGAESLALPDFGLDNETSRDTEREHACLRLQAALADPHGLRAALSPTTEFRPYYDQLGDDPLVGSEHDAVLAREGFRRSESPPWSPHLQAGLRATATVFEAARSLNAADPADSTPPIWRRDDPPTER